MPLDSYALEAFHAVAQSRTFTQAAKRLHITQSALSQRISGLEARLGSTLFLRQKQGAVLTPAGQRLLLFVQAKAKMEEELLGDLSSNGPLLEGIVRVTGFSSVTRSVIIPALADLLRGNSRLRLELQSREIEEISAALLRGETDFAVHFEKIAREGVESELLGHEQYVLAEARKGDIPEAFLDHQENDPVTLLYLRRFDPGHAKVLRRYLADAYGLIDGVASGLGRAVLPLHLIAGDTRIRVVQPGKVLKIPVYLNFFQQPYYTRLHEAVGKALRSEFRRKLG